MRVIAGKFRSRNLASLEGQQTRPTYDRLKETLFNVLSSAGTVEGAAFLDLYAGTGAIAIEALSRGAARAVLVENNRQAARVIRQNLTTLGIANDEAELLECDVSDGLRRLAQQARSFHIIFLDPPYKMAGAYEQPLRFLNENLARAADAGAPALLAPGGIVIAEHEKRFDPGDGTAQLARYRTLAQGDSALSFYKSKE